MAIDVHPAGTIWGIEARRHRVWRLDAPGGAVRLAAGATGDVGDDFASRIFARSGLKVFALDPWNARIDRFDLLGAREIRLDLANAVARAGEERIDAIDFCLSADGDLYVLDRTRGRILQFDDRGRFVRVRVDAEKTGVRSPIALEIDGRGRLFLLGARPAELILLEIDGQIARRAIAADAGELDPISLAVDPWGNAFVGDRRGGNVRVAPEGDAPAWTLLPPAGGMQPTDLAADGARLLVADAPAQTIRIFTLAYRPAAETGR